MGVSDTKHIVPNFADMCIIYYSRTDGCWVAHSVQTDQIGTGQCVIEALASLLQAVKHVVELAEEDETLRVFRVAPSSVLAKFFKARKLPREAYERAYHMVHSKWPEEPISPAIEANKNERFEAQIDEGVLA